MTGAGKTHTMQGTAKEPGIIPRCVDWLMKRYLQKKKHAEATNQVNLFTVTVSYFEIYNEKAYDLLELKDRELEIRQDANKNIVVSNLTEIPIVSYSQFAELYERGCQNRSTASTKLNLQSSRSHAIVTLKIHQREDNPPYRALLSKLHLIDLAGSEDNRKTENTGLRMMESSNINSSLLALGKVVTALNEKQSHIPYRESKLTRILQDSLGGNSLSIIIANVAPGQTYYHDTSNTLRFAAKSKEIINAPTVNVQFPIPSQFSGTKLNPLEKVSQNQRNERNSKESQSKDILVGPSIRGTSIFDATYQSKLEVVEQNLVALAAAAQKKKKLFENREGEVIPVAVLTPKTRHLKVLNQVKKGTEYHKKGLTEAALLCFKKALRIGGPTYQSATLQQKIKELEQELNSHEASLLQNKENLDNGVLLSDTNSRNTAKSKGSTEKKRKRKSESEDDDESPPQKRMKKSKTVEAVKLSIASKLPPDFNRIVEEHKDKVNQILKILNEGSVEEVLELYTIGQKKAGLIMKYRETNKLQNLTQLAEIEGFGERSVLNFIQRNLLEQINAEKNNAYRLTNSQLMN
jgi:kinesin family protein 22